MSSVWWSPGVSVNAEMKPGHAITPFAGDPILPEEPHRALHLHSEECQQGKERHCGGATSQGLCSSPHPISLARGQAAGQDLNPLLSAGCSLWSLSNKSCPHGPIWESHIPNTALPSPPTQVQMFKTIDSIIEGVIATRELWTENQPLVILEERGWGKEAVSDFTLLLPSC